MLILEDLSAEVPDTNVTTMIEKFILITGRHANLHKLEPLAMMPYTERGGLMKFILSVLTPTSG
jgi:hypothetical protein